MVVFIMSIGKAKEVLIDIRVEVNIAILKQVATADSGGLAFLIHSLRIE